MQLKLPQPRRLYKYHCAYKTIVQLRMAPDDYTWVYLCRWIMERLADNFRSRGAFKAWVWSYVPVVGGASAWPSLVFLMVMHFVASCVEQFAQSQASYEHNRELMQEALRLQKQHASR